MDFNKVMIGGRLTRDPELKYLPNGTAVAALSLATNRTWTDSNSKEKREEVLFIDVEFFTKQAESVAKHFKKGRPIFIEGRLKLDQWDTPDGGKRSKIKIIGDQWRFCGDAPKGNGGDGEHEQPKSFAPRSASQRPVQAPASVSPESMGVNEDDIPF